MQNGKGKLPQKGKSKLDYLKEADLKEEDAYFPEEWKRAESSEREKYFDYYDDVKTSIKEDW